MEITRGNNDIIGRLYRAYHTHPIYENGLHYFTNQFLIINFETFPYINTITFQPVVEKSIQLDCGGFLHGFLKEHPQVKYDCITDIPSGFFSYFSIRTFKGNPCIKKYLLNEVQWFNKTFSEIFDDSFIHFRAGSNWIGHSDECVKKRESNLYSVLRYLIN